MLQLNELVGGPFDQCHSSLLYDNNKGVRTLVLTAVGLKVELRLFVILTVDVICLPFGHWLSDFSHPKINNRTETIFSWLMMQLKLSHLFQKYSFKPKFVPTICAERTFLLKVYRFFYSFRLVWYLKSSIKRLEMLLKYLDNRKFF